jgi:rhamnogalacturonan endolyase
VQHVADLVGDWREAIVTFVNGELRVYVTSIPATDRRVTLMQDRLYRNDVTHRSMGYPHVPLTSSFLGVDTPRKP